MNTYDVEIIYKSDETEYDTLYPKTVDDNVTLSNDVLGEFNGDTVADALIELKQSIPSLQVVEQATPVISVDYDTGLITASTTQKAGYVNGGTKISTLQIRSASLPKPVITFNSSTGVVTAAVTETGGFTSGGTETSTYQIPQATQATPTVSVSGSGLITGSVAQTTGWISTGGTKTTTKQLPTQSATTWTPGTSNKTIVSSGYYLTGAQTIKGDSNLIPSNIKNGVTIFGVTGNLVGDETGGQVYSWQRTIPIQVTNDLNYGLILVIPPQTNVDSSGIAKITSASLIGPSHMLLPARGTVNFKYYGFNSLGEGSFYILSQHMFSTKIIPQCETSYVTGGQTYGSGTGEVTVKIGTTATQYVVVTEG